MLCWLARLFPKTFKKMGFCDLNLGCGTTRVCLTQKNVKTPGSRSEKIPDRLIGVAYDVDNNGYDEIWVGDRDGDGKISEEELEEAVDKYGELAGLSEGEKDEIKERIRSDLQQANRYGE